MKLRTTKTEKEIRAEQLAQEQYNRELLSRPYPTGVGACDYHTIKRFNKEDAHRFDH